MASKPTLYKLDPVGDTLLILLNPNAPFAVARQAPEARKAPEAEDERQEQDQQSVVELEIAPGPASQQAGTLGDDQGGEGDDTVEDGKDGEDGETVQEAQNTEAARAEPLPQPQVRMRLSSKHLSLASRYFKGLLSGDWKESKPEAAGADAAGYAFVVTARDWDQKALLMLMSILHGRTARLPMRVSAELLAKVLILVDYYQCEDAAAFFTRLWTLALGTDFPEKYGRDLLLQFFICCKDEAALSFGEMTNIIIREGEGAFDPLGLPIPSNVIAAINDEREDRISGLISGIDELRDDLYSTDSNCSFVCKAINLGALLKGCREIGIDEQHFPKSPYSGWSVSSLESALHKIMESMGGVRPIYSCRNATRKIKVLEGGFCSLQSKIVAIIQAKSGSRAGLRAGDYGLLDLRNGAPGQAAKNED